MSDSTLDGLLTRLNTPDINSNPKAIASQLQTMAKREDGATLLREMLHNGQDPLQAVPPATMTLPYLYILTARLSSQGPVTVHPDYITTFCQQFDLNHARAAPERITLLVRYIQRHAEIVNNPEFPLEALFNLLTHFPPSRSHLTTIHPAFLQACVETRNFAAALPFLTTPLAEFDKTVSDIEYTDVLQYYYLGGVIFGALKRYAEAEEFFETAVSAPAHIASAVQLEAFKKLTLIQLIRHGTTRSPPKYTNSSLIKQMKAIGQYNTLVRFYPAVKGPLTELLNKETNFFTEEGNLGLVKIALEYAPRWAIKNLMNTYSSLSVAQVAKQIDLPGGEAAARGVIVEMIGDGQLSAKLLPDGTLNFEEDALDTGAFSPEAIQAMLLKAQAEGQVLSEIGRDLAGSRPLLARALKEVESPYAGGGSGGGGGVHIMDDEMEVPWRGRDSIQESLFE